ncbi:hypothetical protein PHSC3_001655 [Chlamydiales bacterium STE3]|nr:hypothetical protein PHSC3_001655 [Chlamydiales bacterium STE3]
MAKKLLTFFFYICLCTAYVSATDTNNLPVVVFDFGGVVAEANTTKMANFLIDSFNIDRDELSNAFRDMENQGGTEEQFWKQFAITKNVALPNDWINRFGVIIQESITEIPGTLNLVKELKKQCYQTAILSDMTQYQAEIIRKNGYFDLFNPVVLSHENRVKKPNPEAFQILLKKLKKPASSVIFVDDRIKNVEAAKIHGIDAIHFINLKQLKEELERRGFDLR